MYFIFYIKKPCGIKTFSSRDIQNSSKKTTQGFRQMAKKETHSKLVYNKEFIIKTGIQSLGVFCSSDHITER